MTSDADHLSDIANAVTYPDLNRKITDTNQTGHAKSFLYDANSNLTQETDRNGRIITFAYDNLNRLTSEGTTAQSMTFAYDLAGRMTSASDSSSGITENFTYDNLNRLTAETTNFATRCPLPVACLSSSVAFLLLAT